MAGIGLFNFNIDAKNVEPVAVIALAGLAGFFIWRYLQTQQSAAAQPGSNILDQQYQDALQSSELQSLFGGSTAASTASTANTSTSLSVPTTGATNTDVVASGGLAAVNASNPANTAPVTAPVGGGSAMSIADPIGSF